MADKVILQHNKTTMKGSKYVNLRKRETTSSIVVGRVYNDYVSISDTPVQYSPVLALKQSGPSYYTIVDKNDNILGYSSKYYLEVVGDYVPEVSDYKPYLISSKEDFNSKMLTFDYEGTQQDMVMIVDKNGNWVATFNPNFWEIK